MLSLQQLSQKLHIPPSYLEPIIEELEKEGVVLISEEGRIALAKSPERLTLNTILKLKHVSYLEKLPVVEVLGKKLKEFAPSLFEITLRDLVEKEGAVIIENIRPREEKEWKKL